MLKEQAEQEVLEKEQEAEFLAAEKEAEEALKTQEEQDDKAGISDEVEEEVEETDSELDKNKYKELYPNKTAIKKLTEKEAVKLGKELELPVDIDLKAAENDKIIIEFFEKNIWV